MRVIILTTHALHHVYFVNKIHREFPVHSVFLENQKTARWPLFKKHVKNRKGLFGKMGALILNPYFQLSLMERNVAHFEAKAYFQDNPSDYADGISINHVSSVNDPDVVTEIKKIEPDVIVVFGTGIIKAPLISIPEQGVFNVHRGILPYFRGRDSDLWAIYYGMYDHIGPTIHYLTEGLDTGAIVAQQRYAVKITDKLHELRYYTTLLSTDLVLQVLGKLDKGSDLEEKEQRLEDGHMFKRLPLLLRLYTIVKFRLFKRTIAEKSAI